MALCIGAGLFVGLAGEGVHQDAAEEPAQHCAVQRADPRIAGDGAAAAGAADVALVQQPGHRTECGHQDFQEHVALHLRVHRLNASDGTKVRSPGTGLGEEGHEGRIGRLTRDERWLAVTYLGGYHASCHALPFFVGFWVRQ